MRSRFARGVAWVGVADVLIMLWRVVCHVSLSAGHWMKCMFIGDIGCVDGIFVGFCGHWLGATGG